MTNFGSARHSSEYKIKIYEINTLVLLGAKNDGQLTDKQVRVQVTPVPLLFHNKLSRNQWNQVTSLY